MDIPWLERRGIRWCYAPGCNANSVSEYLVAALLCLAHRHGFRLEGKTLGVVGVGNVGTRVVEKALALGLRVLPNDPPRGRAQGRPQTADGRPQTSFVSLERVCEEADIITFHVPLTAEGPDRTVHMADAEFFRGVKPGVVLVNAARGKVVDTDALLAAMDAGRVAHAVIDTWEGEPAYRADLLDRVALGTPHIAGHSFEGKVAGTLMVYREACRFLGVEPTWTPDALLPPPLVPELTVDAAGRSDESVLRELVRPVYDIEADDRRLRESCVPDAPARAAVFDRLRKTYPMRREFRFTRVTVRNGTPGLERKVRGLGFGY